MYGRKSRTLVGFFGVVVLTILMVLMLGGAASATDYYVDSIGGSDTTGNGTIGSPWQSLNKLNYVDWPNTTNPRIYAPGDSINLKCNSVWNNQTLYLKDNGNCTSSSYVTVQSYSTGNKPKINGGELHAITNATNMAAKMNTTSQTQTRRIILLAGKVLKKISIGKRTGTFTGTWQLASSGNPTIGPISFPSGPPALPVMDYATGWTTASANVDITVTITSGSANASYISFDRFMFGDPGTSINDKWVDLSDLARGSDVTLNGWHPNSTDGINFGTNLWKGRQTYEIHGTYPDVGDFGFEYYDRFNRISGWKIIGIEATSSNSQNPTQQPFGAGTSGIGLAADENGNICKFVEILDCVIHDTSAYGINLQAFGDSIVPTSGIFENVHIRNCDVYNIGTIGIQLLRGRTWYDPNPVDNFFAPLIECCRVHDTGREGIIVNSTKNAVVRACSVYQCGNATSPPPLLFSQAAIEAHDCDGAIYMCNHVYNNHKGGAVGDGGGIDFDWNVRNSILQYNSSWGNEGPGFMFFADGTYFYNNIMRFNYSYNDCLLGGAGGSITLALKEDCRIYNNTAISSTGVPPLVLNKYLDLALLSGNTITNNIFFTNGSSGEVVRHYNFDPDDPNKYRFQNNLYWHLSEDSTNKFVRYYGYWDEFGVWHEGPETYRDFNGWELLVGGSYEIWSNPLLVNPNANPVAGGNIHLLPGSPCIDTGTRPTGDIGTIDYYGNTFLYDPLEIGAAMYSVVRFLNFATEGLPINGWQDYASPDGIDFGTDKWFGNYAYLYGLSSGIVAGLSPSPPIWSSTIYLPTGKRLKYVDIGKAAGVTGTVTFSNGTPSEDRVIDLSSCPIIGYSLNWSNPTPNVTITVSSTCTTSCPYQVGFDNFVFE